ncbi:hypothetical protein CB0940_03463 [Cercospora beticola]|uniref:CENP-V/GFA domain-containing protein n=1 Tax=Cercospora beticola TaxID=122368 RepID=A0A2G5I6N9_CERBT|nr:hypothetical protein CB0940_03463 [Cercospora beticola]PIB00154.1 hypothetical protein CB0940_03463 [Cercospora beticola]WPB00638.1 hypothetical protein RHO25_005258 [Cercospora beticola]CAK1361135.1 unnamed protein product [Cercospora beticola]
MPTKGSCVCGEWTYEYEGEPAGVSICHCIPCHKVAGSNGSFNLIIPEANFKKTAGKDHLFSRTGDSGKSVNYKNCAKCATVMIADIDVMPGVVLVKGGTVDDPAVDAKNAPQMEIYRKNAAPWCTAWSGVAQVDGAPS